MVIIVRQILILCLGLSVGLAVLSAPLVVPKIAAASGIVNCSARGLRTIPPVAEGNPVSATPPHHVCFACCLLFTRISVSPVRVGDLWRTGRSVVFPASGFIKADFAPARLRIRAPPEGLVLIS